MVVPVELLDVRTKILDQVKSAAQRGDVEAINGWGKHAERCEGLISESADLESRIRVFLESLGSELSESPATKEPASGSGEAPRARKGVSTKQEGAQTRDEWVRALAKKGIQLTGHGKRYRTRKEKSVGIAFANELDQPQLEDRWFLGLKDEPTDVAVLLCRDAKNQRVYDLLLPVPELGPAWMALSRNGGQIKFNIRKEAGEFVLAVPRGAAIQVTRYLGNYRSLNGLTD